METGGAATSEATAGLAARAAPALLRARMLRLAVDPSLSGWSATDHVALTFDDGPDPGGTPLVLDALRELGLSATFFLLGTQVRRHPELAERVAAEGHEVAVHGFLHRNHLLRSATDVRRDVAFATRLIGRTTGVTPSWFRPPYGVLTSASLSAAHDAGLRPVLWTAWGRDWVTRDPDRVLRNVARQLHAGGTVLLHDSDCTTRTSRSWASAVGALPRLAALVDHLGCRLGPLREHFGRP